MIILNPSRDSHRSFSAYSITAAWQVDPMAIKVNKVCKSSGLQSVGCIWQMVLANGNELSPKGLALMWLKQDLAEIVC